VRIRRGSVMALAKLMSGRATPVALSGRSTPSGAAKPRRCKTVPPDQSGQHGKYGSLGDYKIAKSMKIPARRGEAKSLPAVEKSGVPGTDMESGLDMNGVVDLTDTQQEMDDVNLLNEAIDEPQDSMAMAVWNITFGTALVMLLSDPMVDVLNNFAKTVGISAFYISFMVTPLVSNASEVVCSMHMAERLDNENLTEALSTLFGAATMNSTFCLSIFFALIYFRGLSWNYSAEVISTLFVTTLIGVMGMRRVFTTRDAVLALLLFPASLVIVWTLENEFGLQ